MTLKSVLKHVVRLHEDQTGQGLVEYLLVLALVALAATAGMKNSLPALTVHSAH